MPSPEQKHYIVLLWPEQRVHKSKATAMLLRISDLEQSGSRSRDPNFNNISRLDLNYLNLGRVLSTPYRILRGHHYKNISFCLSMISEWGLMVSKWGVISPCSMRQSSNTVWSGQFVKWCSISNIGGGRGGSSCIPHRKRARLIEQWCIPYQTL